MSMPAILKIIRTNIRREPDCHLYCTVSRQFLLAHFNIAKFFNDHILFQEYTTFKFVCLLYKLTSTYPRNCESFKSLESDFNGFYKICVTHIQVYFTYRCLGTILSEMKHNCFDATQTECTQILFLDLADPHFIR